MAATAPGSGNWRFVGWNTFDRPATARDVANLAEEAQHAFVLYRESGLWPRQVPFADLEAVEYVLTGPAIDFADHGSTLAQDQVQYVVLDGGGDRRDVALGELALLEGIAQARTPWQTVGKSVSAEMATSAIQYRTVFVPHPEGPAARGLALLFRPTLPESGNDAAFRSFARQTLSRLLVLDESAAVVQRKGYLEAAAQVAGAPPGGGAVGALTWLRRFGMVDFSDNWLKGWHRHRARAQMALVKILRSIGVVEISAERMAQIADARPDYRVDDLETDGLIDLAEAMFWAARTALRTGR